MTTIPNARIWHPDGWHHGTKFQLDLHGRIEQEVEAGDHFIVVGGVAELGHRADARPLLYHRGSYANVVAAGEDAPATERWRQRPSV